MAETRYSLAATANTKPNKPAIIDGQSGEIVTYGQLERVLDVLRVCSPSLAFGVATTSPS